MTRQKFYEMCVLKTYEYGGPEHIERELERLGDVSEMGFAELMMRRGLLGMPNIPLKQNFKEWGVDYLCQLLGFALWTGDNKFLNDYIKFLKINKSLYRKPHDHEVLGNFFWDALYDNITKNRSNCEKLGSFIVFHFKDLPWYGKFLTVANALGFMDVDAYREYLKDRQCGLAALMEDKP